ncbi:Gfo/Idh/MocA family protein [Paenibacillus marinisediminis]
MNLIKPLRWGIMSTAYIAARAVIPAIEQSQHGILEAVASRDLGKAKQMAEQFKIAKAYGSYEELLADEEIDAVYIPLPNHLHKEWVLRAAASGKHVLCEKPLALNAAEAREMVAGCAAAGVHLAEAFMYRHHPRMEQIRSLIDAGEIGEIRGIHGAFTFNNARDFNNIRYRVDWGGGSLYDVGCYPLSAARYFLGREPEAVTVHAMFSAEHGDVDMMASGLVEFSDGIALTFDCGMWADNRQTLEILGTDGRIVLPVAYSAGVDNAAYRVISRGIEREEVPEPTNPYVAQADNFARAVARQPTLPLAADDAVHNMKLLEACLHAARERSRIVLSDRP